MREDVHSEPMTVLKDAEVYTSDGKSAGKIVALFSLSAILPATIAQRMMTMETGRFGGNQTTDTNTNFIL